MQDVCGADAQKSTHYRARAIGRGLEPMERDLVQRPREGDASEAPEHGTGLAGHNGLRDSKGFFDNRVGATGSGHRCMLEVGDA